MNAFTHRRRLLLAACTSIPAFAFTLVGCDKPSVAAAPKASFKAVDITGTEMGAGLKLADVDGKPRTMADFKGKVAVVFFGYTQCPDVCPTTLAELAEIKKALGPDGDKLQPVFVSIDPERDTAEILKSYMAAFGPGFIALRGTPEQTTAAAKSFKVFFQKVPGKTPDSYTMDHTAGSYIFDASGQPRLFVRYGQPVQDWVSDIKQLMA